MWQKQKVSLVLSVKHGQRSASEKKNEVCNASGGMFDLSPLLLWSEEHLCSWAVSRCFAEYTAFAVHEENLAKGVVSI